MIDDKARRTYKPQLRSPDNARPELHGQAAKNTGRSAERPKDSSECLFEHARTCQDSILLGEEREERRAYVTDKINKINTHCSPEPSMALTPSNLLSASPTSHLPPTQNTHLHCVPDEPAWESEPEQQTYDASQGEKIGTNECLPGGLVAEALSVPSATHKAQSPPAISTQITPVRQLPDEPPLSVEMVPRRDLSIVSSKHPVSDKRLQKAKTVRRQSEGTPSRGVKGECLAQAAAYIQERLRKRSLACEECSSQVCDCWPSETPEAKAGQCETDTIRERTTGIAEHVPCVGKAAARDIGLSEMENTHGVVMLKSSGAVARQ
jgi:hypothetical protein